MQRRLFRVEYREEAGFSSEEENTLQSRDASITIHESDTSLEMKLRHQHLIARDANRSVRCRTNEQCRDVANVKHVAGEPKLGN